MEDMQLDFNQPLLSVRRFSSTGVASEAENKRKVEKSLPQLPPLPVYKSELKSGPIRNPGTVPFVWERTPGRPKDERTSQLQAPERPPSTPKLPPGRVSNIKVQASEKVSKSTSATQSQTASILSGSRDVSDLDKRNGTNDKGARQGREENSSSASEDGDEAYVDALDTLSRSESFFMNCSVSGVSGYDGPDVKASGTFSTDPQTRDFMMDRFLPAAKAMASETPQYAPRKQQVVWEQPRQVNKVVNGDMWPPLNQRRPNVLSHYAQEIGEEGSEDESDNCESSDILSAKVCGLFPRFCIKNSFCLLNPVLGMKMQAQLPVSSVCRVRAKSSNANSCSETNRQQAVDVISEQRLMSLQQTAGGNEGKIRLKCGSYEIEEKSESQNLVRLSLYRHPRGDGLSANHNEYSLSKFHEQKGFLGVPETSKISRNNGFDINKSARTNFRELLNNENTTLEVGSGSPVVEKTLYIDAVHSVKSHSSNSSSSDAKFLTDCKANGVEISEKSSDMEDTPSLNSSLLDIKHLSIVNQEATARPKSLESVDSFFLSCSGRSTNKKPMDVKIGCNLAEDLIDDSLALISSKVTHQENFNLENERSLKSCDKEKHPDLAKDSILITSSKVAGNKIDLKSQHHLKLNNQEYFHGHNKNPITLTSSKKTGDDRKIDTESQQLMKLGTEENSEALIQSSTPKAPKNKVIDLESQRLVKLDNQESPSGSYLQMPLALPMPKSPSESWLKRTLPTISSKNSHSWSSLDARICSSSPVRPSLDPKWETIVKTSNLQHGRFSQENISPIPEA
ncbi:hypothetical protein PanWU01x14_276600 [Parasponia andersonii]|uniref:Uncharacterized protein n=1 Tax=Parasponia andersonii TaxID=3476 RepID=A0A2P5B2T9_PARAD|nr:hypothetical protein PanWU01x14_276600 [Parasponia andersonii]